jgi:hypothetical protein
MQALAAGMATIAPTGLEPREGAKKKLTTTGLATRPSARIRDTRVLAMSRRLLFVFVAGLALSGCAESGRYIQPPTNALANWDGLGPVPKRNRVKPVKVRKTSEDVVSRDNSPSEDELARLKPYSQEWTALLDGINRAADDKLRRKLIICRGCMPPEAGDQTSSIAVGGSPSFRQ